VPEREGQVAGRGPETCRYCRRPLRPADPDHARFWPFCSERCKMAELGLWFEGRYVLSRPTEDVADDASAPPPKPPAGPDRE